MGLIAILAAFVIGAVSATALKVFSFAVALVAVVIVGAAMAAAMGASLACAVGSGLALGASAQVGYAIGLAARAFIGDRRRPSRPLPSPRPSHFWARK